MLSNSEQIKKADKLLQKARDIHKKTVGKAFSDENMKIIKVAKQLNFIDYDFSDKELLNGFSHIIDLKNSNSPILNDDEKRKKPKMSFHKPETNDS